MNQPTSHHIKLSQRDWILLLLLTLFWGINWPIMKLGVREYPPLTFRLLGMLIGLPVIWAAARYQGVAMRLAPGEVKRVMLLAIPNMLLWHMLIILGVKLLSSGRAAILGYTMPVWAVLIGLLVFRQRVSAMAWLGVGLTFGGALLLLSSEFTAMSGQPVGSLLALAAAASWAWGTLALKRAELKSSTMAVTFWMLSLTSLMMLGAAIVFELPAWRMPDAREWAAILYNAFIVFGFAHVVWFNLARSLPPTASSLSVMMIPVVGVFSGAWMLNETLHWQDWGAMLLILAGMSTVLLKKPA